MAWGRYGGSRRSGGGSRAASAGREGDTSQGGKNPGPGGGMPHARRQTEERGGEGAACMSEPRRGGGIPTSCMAVEGEG